MPRHGTRWLGRLWGGRRSATSPAHREPTLSESVREAEDASEVEWQIAVDIDRDAAEREAWLSAYDAAQDAAWRAENTATPQPDPWRPPVARPHRPPDVRADRSHPDAVRGRDPWRPPAAQPAQPDHAHAVVVPEDAELASIRGRLADLTDGVITDEDLARVGVTPDELDRVVDADMDAEAEAYHARRAAEQAAITTYAAQLTREQAQEITGRASELEQHSRGCNLPVEQCATCCGQQRDSAAMWWEFDVPAAYQRLTRDDRPTDPAAAVAPDIHIGHDDPTIEDDNDSYVQFGQPWDAAMRAENGTQNALAPFGQPRERDERTFTEHIRAQAEAAAAARTPEEQRVWDQNWADYEAAEPALRVAEGEPSPESWEPPAEWYEQTAQPAPASVEDTNPWSPPPSTGNDDDPEFRAHATHGDTTMDPACGYCPDEAEIQDYQASLARTDNEPATEPRRVGAALREADSAIRRIDEVIADNDLADAQQERLEQVTRWCADDHAAQTDQAAGRDLELRR